MNLVLEFASHPCEERLELYALGRIREHESSGLEEHLLVCPACQDLLEQNDAYIAAMKSVPASWGPASGDWPGQEFLPGMIPVSRAAGVVVSVGLAAFAAFAALGVHKPEMLNLSETPVELVSLRGGEGDGLTRAEAGRPLKLQMDAPDLPREANCRLEIVRVSGKQEWSGTPAHENDRLAAHIHGGLPAGSYWVRLYAPGSEILTEYGLRVE